ncbi:MAG TPA: hypothetical protein VFL03_07145 [Candidatus Limnocylindrales bacterium]|jgi:hypothetical protein|nr:hypothetical protein [Candidatus Limnocylindrales bacterium]
MTDSRDRISGPAPADAMDDPDSQTFFEGQAPVGDAGGDALGDGSTPNAGYTGGLAEGTQSGAGMRQIVVDEATERRREGTDDEPPANLAQQDQ